MAGLAYAGSKACAERALWKWTEENKPLFCVSAINPSNVTGPPVLFPESPAMLSANLLPIWKIFPGEAKEIPPGVGSMPYIDVRDVTRTTVWIMEHPKESDGQRYLCSNGKGTMQAAADILRNEYRDRDIVKGHPRADYVDGYGYPSGAKSFHSTKAKDAMGGDDWPPAGITRQQPVAW